MKTLERTMILAASALALVVGGCGGATVSQQLVDARQTMNQARAGLASELEPDEVRQAERLLDRAEQAADGSEQEQHFAYLADRQARVAMANAQRMHVGQQMTQVQDEYRRELESAAIAQNDRLRIVQQDLQNVRRELADRGDVIDEHTRELQAREQELAAREAQLMAEREARLEAERRAADAMSRLAELAQVREERDETIITLSGEVLFETGRATLRPEARQRLEAVATALRTQPDRRVRIEGHTDSRGSDDDNMELSRQRARAVRQLMVEEGVDPSRLEAVGRGETEPIADNRSPEGRANNRRVEIVLEQAPEPQQAAGQAPGEPQASRTPTAPEEAQQQEPGQQEPGQQEPQASRTPRDEPISQR